MVMTQQEKKIVLPKQWKDWCRRAGLRTMGPRRKWERNWRSSWLYLQGRGHVWRINCYGEFQCGDTHEDFDRWARCYIVYVDFDIFKSRDQFVNIVKQLAVFQEKTFPNGEATDDQDWNVLMEAE
jgi:hypothetical protein